MPANHSITNVLSPKFSALRHGLDWLAEKPPRSPATDLAKVLF